MRNLVNNHIMRLLPGEEMLEVQRQHWIAVFVPIFVTGVFSLGLLSMPFLAMNQQIIATDLRMFAVNLALVGLSLLTVVGTFIFMTWYYQFYIITNKRIAHIHFFRLGGYFLEEVFLEKSAGREIDCLASNIIYDFLGIEDVRVYFQRLERPEPFIFKTPHNAEKIETILENLSQDGTRT